MGKAPISNKLSDAHVNEIARYSALGQTQGQIREALASGIASESGTLLPPVEVTRQAVQQRLGSAAGRERVRGWMRHLYGDIYAEPAAYPGARLRRLERLYQRAIAAADDADKISSRLRALGEARAVIEAIGRLVQEAGPVLRLTADSRGNSRVEATANGTGLRLGDQERAALARDLQRAMKHGLLDEETQAFIEGGVLRMKLGQLGVG